MSVPARYVTDEDLARAADLLAADAEYGLG